MKVIIIGGVAGGASAAARLRRLNEKAEIIIFERGEYISYANCGLPYYIGGEITDKKALTLQTPESFKSRFNIDVRTLCNVKSINREAKTVTVEDPENAEYWSIVGLLHDIDYEMYPDEHCIKSFEIFKEEGIDESFAKSVASHCYGLAEGRDIKPEHIMEKYLFAVDELTGLIGAAARMRPSKSCSDMELKSLMKKYKSPSFAAGCSREVIARGAEMLKKACY